MFSVQKSENFVSIIVLRFHIEPVKDLKSPFEFQVEPFQICLA